MKTQVNVGCSSYNEFRWKGVFYPEDLPRSKWFEHYCRYFNTYEMNASFYKFPTDKGLAGWYAKSPENFRFAVKMYKGVTHYKKFNECEQLISDFYTVCRENLKEKLAVVLFQMPKSFVYSEQRLSMLIESVDPTFTNAVEFRHESWWRQEVYDALGANGIIFCSVSYPGLSEDIVATANKGYIRLHGNQKLFYSGYDREALATLQTEIAATGWDEAFVYFNNTASTEGILNALELDKMVK